MRNITNEQLSIMARKSAEMHYNAVKKQDWPSFDEHFRKNPAAHELWKTIVRGIITAADTIPAVVSAVNEATKALPADMLIQQGEAAAGAVREVAASPALAAPYGRPQPFTGTEPHPGLRKAIPGDLPAGRAAERAEAVKALLAEFDTLSKVRGQVGVDIERGKSVLWIGAFWWPLVVRSGKVTRLDGDLNERDGYNEHGELEDGTKFRITPLIISPGFFRANIEGPQLDWIEVHIPCLTVGMAARKQYGQA